MNLKYVLPLLFLIDLFSPIAYSAESKLLTGIITSAENHLVTAPKGRRWRVQIQWMADEGSVVKEGDMVAVFDSGGIEDQLEQNEERLAMERLELLKTEMDLKQAALEAKGRLTLANIMVEKTRIEASIPDGEISAYEKGKHIVEYEKALMEKIKAEESHKLSLEEQAVGIDKQKIELVKLQENIAYQQRQLETLSVRSKVTGPVSYMRHQWMDQKISVGMNVQASWKVLMVQAQAAYQVTAWLHEFDAAKVDLNSSAFELTLDAYPGKRYRGKLLSSTSQAEQKSEWGDGAYYRLEIGFDEPIENDIYPGMSVRVKLNDQQTVRL